MARADAQSLRAYVRDTAPDAFLLDRAARARVADLLHATRLGRDVAELAGRSVLLATASQLTSALALIELDGIARRITVLPPDVDPAHLGALSANAEIDAVVTDPEAPDYLFSLGGVRVVCGPSPLPVERKPAALCRTEWVLLTSGTTGVPKMVAHSLGGLTQAIKPRTDPRPVVWGTFYDIRRYGGLQIFLRAVLGGASLVLSSAGEAVSDHLARLARHGVTHLTGTPSHWRRALMSPAISAISLRYVRLSGEIADQAVLDSLHAAFPQASIGHAYASTEAGVAFHVDDGLAGFPADFVEPPPYASPHATTEREGGVRMRVVEGSLRVRSLGAASRYVGKQQAALAAADGFVDTGDMVERRVGRYFFVGRKGGIINIGGLKVHPEEVEAVINRHPQVRMSLVRPKKSPITGAIVIADVVLNSACEHAEGRRAIESDILEHCRNALPRHKVPAAISFVPALAVSSTGKLARRAG